MEQEIIKVSNVTMTYTMSATNILSFKEWILSVIKKKIQYNKFSPLEDINFSINKGDVLGVIGINGAGKSTLLKLISGIMKPTNGNIYVGGNIVPMLELGAGFDYDLTGKENIYLNGAILGYSKQFLEDHYESIVAFSELGEFINMPLRTYSSGMQMRLAFSIAAVVEPDVLICDEILSVGDDHFKEKSFNRMKEMMSGGTTVILVSHDINQIRKMCNKVLWLEEHRVKMFGQTDEICDFYKIYLSINDKYPYLVKYNKGFDISFFKKSVQYGYTVTCKQKKLWAVELDLACKLLDVCKKHNLRIFAEAGTLLGAVRHNGFIPWDDDMDFVMFRDDYDKLIAECLNEFEQPYFLQCAYTDTNYIYGHAQLRNSNTTALLDEWWDEPFNRGIFIDIFVLDGVPDDILNKNSLERKINQIKAILWEKAHNGKLDIEQLANIPNSLKERDNLLEYFAYSENLLRDNSIATCKMVAPLNFVFETEKRVRNKNMYDETILLDFEGIKLPVPKSYDSYLKHRYGDDYLTPKYIPTTHGHLTFNTEIPYSDYIKRNTKYEKI